jgi:hypothetical protein
LTTGVITITGFGRYQLKMILSSPRELRWLSEREFAEGSQQVIVKRRLFTPDHEIWHHIDENDILAIEDISPFVGRRSRVSDGRVQFWDKFDPTLLG